MKSIFRILVHTAFFVILFSLLVVTTASAQSASSILGSVEKYIGPIYPYAGLGSTFRTEVATGIGYVKNGQQKLSGGSFSSTVGLRERAFLEKQSLRYDLYGKLRLWRFCFRPQYTMYDQRSNNPEFGKFSFTGVILGGDFDVIQNCWFAAGASIDFYLMGPEFHGTLLWPGNSVTNLDLVGDKPTTVGAYIRYIPPEIWGIPVHLEATGKIPISGCKLTTYCFSAVWRPQLYRFDIGARGYYERSQLNFDDRHESRPYLQNINMDAEWTTAGMDITVYF